MVCFCFYNYNVMLQGGSCRWPQQCSWRERLLRAQEGQDLLWCQVLHFRRPYERSYGCCKLTKFIIWIESVLRAFAVHMSLEVISWILPGNATRWLHTPFLLIRRTDAWTPMEMLLCKWFWLWLVPKSGMLLYIFCWSIDFLELPIRRAGSIEDASRTLIQIYESFVK